MSTKKKLTSKIHKKSEFEAFIKLLKTGKVDRFLSVAEALNVDKNTISTWKKHPIAQAAIAEGVEYCIEKMEVSGKRDWRMWRERLKLLGIADIQKNEITGADGSAIQVEIVEDTELKDANESPAKD